MENAILLASGLGTRMRPITEKVPKPLVKVHGIPMIETVIDGLIARGVANIYVVVGYLAESFEYLTEKYKNVFLVENKEYQIINNISSVYAARNILDSADCFICEADLYLKDLDILKADLNSSCYFGKMVKGYSDDWLFDCDEHGFITRVGKAGTDRYNMVGIAFLKKQDAAVLKKCIEKTYLRKGYEKMFWDDVVNENLDRLKLKVHPIESGQIYEIDTVDELNEINSENWRTK